MDLLLDTQVFLWWQAVSERLRAEHRVLIARPTNRIFISVVTVWEIGIKRSQGKLPLEGSIVEAVALNRFELLPVTAADAERNERLPHHHKDPFDRMIIAQSIERDLAIMTSDAQFAQYGVPIVDVR